MGHFYNLCISILFLVSATSRICLSENVTTSNDGDWLYFMEDHGPNLVLNFTSIIEDTQDVIIGDVYFYLYTRNNQYIAERLVIPDSNKPSDSVYFNKSNSIRVVTHGWKGRENDNWLQNVRKSLLRTYDVNVITVDWYELSKSDIYPLAAISTRYVGNRLAQLLNTLMETYNVTGQSIHLIGHSLGAQIMGYAGMFSKDKISRITGLDPARPLFEIPIMPLDFRLDKSDADFVDIIHTCGGVYGYKRSSGHADFFPNNGLPTQPGCSGDKLHIEVCSHGRSHEYFEESIEYNSNYGFIAYACESWEKFEKEECNENPTSSMGYPADTKSNGNYYLRTRNESKYAMQ